MRRDIDGTPIYTITRKALIETRLARMQAAGNSDCVEALWHNLQADYPDFHFSWSYTARVARLWRQRQQRQ